MYISTYAQTCGCKNISVRTYKYTCTHACISHTDTDKLQYVRVYTYTSTHACTSHTHTDKLQYVRV